MADSSKLQPTAWCAGNDLTVGTRTLLAGPLLGGGVHGGPIGFGPRLVIARPLPPPHLRILNLVLQTFAHIVLEKRRRALATLPFAFPALLAERGIVGRVASC